MQNGTMMGFYTKTRKSELRLGKAIETTFGLLIEVIDRKKRKFLDYSY
jgi:hypothetical protein